MSISRENWKKTDGDNGENEANLLMGDAINNFKTV
jgi:hypothetical protein